MGYLLFRRGKEMDYVYLTDEFFDKYKDNDQIKQKTTRLYILLDNGKGYFAVALCSKINHPYRLYVNEEDKSGVDYSKKVALSYEYKEKFIDKNAIVKPKYYKFLKDKDHEVKTGVDRYIKRYKKALKAPNQKHNNTIIKNSALQSFHNEIGIE